MSSQGLLVPALLCESSPRRYNWPLSCFCLFLLNPVGQRPPVLEFKHWIYNVYWASCHQSSSGSGTNVSLGLIDGGKVIPQWVCWRYIWSRKHVDFILQFPPCRVTAGWPCFLTECHSSFGNVLHTTLSPTTAPFPPCPLGKGQWRFPYC